MTDLEPDNFTSEEKKDSLASKDNLVVRPATENDAENICALFQTVFKEKMTTHHWRWKYNRPDSRAIVVYKNDRLVAHYGGVGTQMLLNGDASTAIQISDLMVDPQARHAVRSQSPFYLSAKKFLETYVGYDKPFFLAYGFPSDRAMALSEKLGLYKTVGHITEISWQLDRGGRKSSRKKIVKLDSDNWPRLYHDINNLWDTFSGLFRNHFICKKDADYFHWRYLLHPSKTYSVYLVLSRFRKKPEAVIVLRHDKKKSMLMDVLCRSMDLSSALLAAEEIASKEKNKTLVTWSSDVFAAHFSINQAHLKTLAVAIPANTCSPGCPPQEQQDKWWFMPGDTDYL